MFKTHVFKYLQRSYRQCFKVSELILAKALKSCPSFTCTSSLLENKDHIQTAPT